MPSSYDVIVSGAGPSGSRAAYLCAKAGLSTLLLEKRPLPRDKCCAGGLLLRASKALGEQGEGASRQRDIHGISIWVSGRRYDWRTTEDLGCTVLRRDLDCHLAERAGRQGCEVRAGARMTGVEERGDRVEVVVGQERLEASYLILAEGTASGNAREVLGPYPRGALLNAASLLCREDAGLEDRAGFILPGAEEAPAFARSGASICAAFPVREGVVLSTTSPASGPSLLGALREVARLHGLSPERDGCIHPIAVRPRAHLASTRCLCVGDCAGLASPFSGEGITPSLLSADLAAEAVTASLRSGRPGLGSYEGRVRARVERDQLMARLTGATLRLALRGHWTPALLAGLEADEHFGRAFASAAGREDGSRRFLLRMLPRLPALLAKGSSR